MPNLHFEVLPKIQRKIWEKLQAEAGKLNDFGYYLAGGTALALQLGHRQSIDFDFFSQKSRQAENTHRLLRRFEGYVLRETDADTVHAELSGVKVSFIGAYKYPVIGRFVKAGEVRLASIVDIGLMKLLAVTHRATLRDYIDLAAIIRDHVSLEEIIRKSKRKYGRTFNPFLSLKALISFEDVEPETPRLLDKTLSPSWQEILGQAVKKLARR